MFLSLSSSQMHNLFPNSFLFFKVIQTATFALLNVVAVVFLYILWGGRAQHSRYIHIFCFSTKMTVDIVHYIEVASVFEKSLNTFIIYDRNCQFQIFHVERPEQGGTHYVIHLIVADKIL